MTNVEPYIAAVFKWLTIVDPNYTLPAARIKTNELRELMEAVHAPSPRPGDMTTGKDKIRGALEAVNEYFDRVAHDERVTGWVHREDYGLYCLLADPDCGPQVDEALAEMDRIDAAPKVLTDEEVERVADVEHIDSGNRMSMMWREGFVEGMRYARDHYGIGAHGPGLTVDEAMQAIEDDIATQAMERLFRQRLAAALTAKASPPKEQPVGAAPLLEFRSKVSSMWYRTPQAAGDVDAVRLFVPGVELPFFYSLDPTAS